MRSAWRAHAAGERQVPVEMRFIDMFMAALGSLVFMAMLLSFLLRYIPPGKPIPGQPAPPPPSALRIVTRALPPAYVGEPYEVAFAYRGGAGAVVWQVPAGLTELPTGLRFDAQRGLLTGTPGERAIARFVLQAADLHGGEDRRPLELVVQAARKSSKRPEVISAAVVAVLLLLANWISQKIIGGFRQRLGALQEAWAQGKSEVIWMNGPEKEIVQAMRASLLASAVARTL